MQRFDFNKEWFFQRQGCADAQAVTLPHDAMIHEPRDPKGVTGSAGAFFPGGVYEYEKTFLVPADWADKCAAFEFEGVYKHSKVYLNGKEAGGRAYGYSNFFIEADAFLQYGMANTIRVVADNSAQPDSRWYTGSGIYRPVSLWLGNKLHIRPEGIRISTLSYQPARIRVEVLTSSDPKHVEGYAGAGLGNSDDERIGVEILQEGLVIASGEGSLVEFELPDAKLWSEDSPNLHQCRVTLRVNGEAADVATTAFGIRKLEWSSGGLFVNGRETLLRGGCVHHDNGIVGACSYAESEERRVRILKEAGYNAIRSSHNPASKAMLDACDKYGIHVMDETFDMWYMRKNRHDYASDFEACFADDIRSMVSRDFNHPSVILYSIGNEVAEPFEEKGIALTRQMVGMIHEMDGNRAVTAGINLMIVHRASKGKSFFKDADETDDKGEMAADGRNSAKQNSARSKINEKGANHKGTKKSESPNASLLFNMIASFVGTGMNKAANSDAADRITAPCLDALDIAGYNYTSGRYRMEGGKHPDRILVGSETFPQDIYRNWQMVKELPYLIGDFMWTAWDYLGEAGLGAWSYTGGMPFKRPYPWILAGSGAIDLLGDIGAEARYAATVWGLEKSPVLCVKPVNHPGVRVSKSVWRGTNAIESWSWRNCDGNRAEIEVYSEAAFVRLVLNGKEIATRKVKACKANFRTKYAPGTLAAFALDKDRKEIGKAELHSATGTPVLAVHTEKPLVGAGEVFHVNISISGRNGVVERNADDRLTIRVENGELLGLGSANPCTEERYDGDSCTTHYGRAQAVIRAGMAGPIRVTAFGENLEPVSSTFQVEAQHA